MEFFDSLDFKTEPQNLRWTLSCARGYFELGMYSAAEGELDKLSVRHRCFADVIELRVLVMMARHRYEQAAWLAHSASKLYPGEAGFYTLAGRAYEAMKNPGAAKAVWLKAPPAFQVTGDFHYNLACYEAQLGNESRAKHHIALAIQLDPKIRDRAENDPRLREVLPRALTG